MKRIYILLITFLALLTSCRYEESSFSFKSPENRLIGYWLLQETYLNGNLVDSTDYEANNPFLNLYYYSFDGFLLVTSYMENSITESTGASTWTFKDKKSTLTLNFTLFNKRYRYDAEIIKLSERELKYRYSDSYGDEWELHLYKRGS